MHRSSLLGARVLGGLFAVALSALPQAYTISAKPGAVNYIEGDVTLDGVSIGSASLKSTFLNAGSLLETHAGKVEVLLTPGVFLRVGENSRVRMLKAALVDTQIAIEAGESMIEADQYEKESRLTVSMRGGLTVLEKTVCTALWPTVRTQPSTLWKARRTSPSAISTARLARATRRS